MLESLRRGEDLTAEQTEELVGVMISGQLPETEVEQALVALREKGVTVEELVGAARAMRGAMQRIRHHRSHVVDTCGTGGAGSGTFNVSTAAAFIVAATGVPVAKHGNRKVSSRSGSADVLTELGVNIFAPLDTVERCLDEVGICFCFAQMLHPAMKHVAGVRQRLAVPTIFNLLGPLCNPAAATTQMLGVGKPDVRPLLAAALQQLGTEQAIVVHGRDGLAEISNAAETDVTVVGGDLREETWSPQDFGFAASSRTPLLAADPPASARIIREVFAGQPGPAREIVVMNAAATLWISEAAGSLSEGVQQAEQAIDSGRAAEVLRQLGEVSHAC